MREAGGRGWWSPAEGPRPGSLCLQAHVGAHRRAGRTGCPHASSRRGPWPPPWRGRSTRCRRCGRPMAERLSTAVRVAPLQELPGCRHGGPRCVRSPQPLGRSSAVSTGRVQVPPAGFSTAGKAGFGASVDVGAAHLRPFLGLNFTPAGAHGPCARRQGAVLPHVGRSFLSLL